MEAKAKYMDLNKEAQRLLDSKQLGYAAEITVPLEDIITANGKEYQLQLLITSDTSKIIKYE